MKWSELFSKKKAPVVQVTTVAHPITINPGKREQAIRTAARLHRLYLMRDKYGSSEELTADIARHQKALRLAEIEVPENVADAEALAGRLRG